MIRKTDNSKAVVKSLSFSPHSGAHDYFIALEFKNSVKIAHFVAFWARDQSRYIRHNLVIVSTSNYLFAKSPSVLIAFRSLIACLKVNVDLSLVSMQGCRRVRKKPCNSKRIPHFNSTNYL